MRDACRLANWPTTSRTRPRRWRKGRARALPAWPPSAPSWVPPPRRAPALAGREGPYGQDRAKAIGVGREALSNRANVVRKEAASADLGAKMGQLAVQTVTKDVVKPA
jgi:hypothetical protein